jgi:hypothetical protein
VDPSHTSTTLVSIAILLIDPKNPQYKQIDKDIDIKFGSLFVNLRPSVINGLMKYFIPKEEKSHPDAAISKKDEPSSQATGASTSAVMNRDTSKLMNIQEDKALLLKVNFSLERISVFLINEIQNVYLAHASVSAINIEFISKLTGIQLKGTLSNLQLHDLTNYPNTLTNCSFEKIVPNELFGISKGENQDQSLIYLEFQSINAAIAQLPEENVSGYLTVNIEQVKIDFFMQVVMRILDFLTGHLLPALNIDDGPAQDTLAAANLIADLLMPEEMDDRKKEIYLSNLRNPFWMKMNIKVCQPIILLKCHPSHTDYLQVELGIITIKNVRAKNASRLIYNLADKKHKELGLGDELEGIWCENFYISMESMSIKKISEQQGKRCYSYLMHPFNFNLGLIMPQYTDEYKHLFNGKVHLMEGYTSYTLKEKKKNPVIDNGQTELYYDSGLGIRARISPMIMIFGNSEFNFIMKTLFHNITYNDFQDRHFVKSYEDIKLKQEIEKKEDTGVGSSMSIIIDIDYIAMVAMETQEIDQKQIDGDRIRETRRVYAKLFIKELRVDMIMHSKGDMEIGTYIRKLIACHLEEKDPQNKPLEFIEKGFIGKMNATNEYKTTDCDDFRNQIVKYLNDTISEKGETGSFGLSSYDTNGLVFDLNMEMRSDGTKDMKMIVQGMKILAQTNVLLKLSGLAQMSPDCTPPEPEVDAVVKKMELERLAKEKEKRLKDIKEYFARKLLRGQDNSKSFSSMSENRNKQRVMMKINIEIRNVMFVIPTKELAETLVTSGDLDILLEMYEQRNELEVWEIQEGLLKLKKDENTIESQNMGMKINVQLLDFQIFYCDFVKLLKTEWKKVPKRHILMPVAFRLYMIDHAPVCKNKEALQFYSYKRITGGAKSMIFKLALSDMDVLNRIAAHQMAMLAEASPPPQPDLKALATEQEEKIKKLTEDKPDVQGRELAKMGPKDDLLVNPKKPANPSPEFEPPNKLLISDFAIEGFQFFVINDDQKIFVPVLDFSISNIKLNMKQVKDMDLKLCMALGVEYYNSTVSKWEPFIEKTGFMLNLATTNRNGLNATHLYFKIDEVEENVEEIFNINLSVKALAVVMNSLNTLSAWNVKRAEEEKKTEEYYRSGQIFSHSEYRRNRDPGHRKEGRGR